VLSRGDKNLSEFLIYVYKNGGNIGAYKAGAKALNLDLTKMINGYDFDDVLPWDIIEYHPPKKILINEYNRLAKYSDCFFLLYPALHI
jgi:hypothetical protein